MFKKRSDIGTYRVRGFARDRMLDIYREKDGKRLGIATSLVQAVGLGDRLEGFYCGYDSTRSAIRSDKCTWIRLEPRKEEQEELT